MQPVVGIEGVAYVGCTLVNIHRRSCRAHKSRPSTGTRVSQGNKVQQLLDCRIGYRSALRSRQYSRTGIYSLPLAQAFVAQEIECVVLPERPAYGTTKIVALKGGLALVQACRACLPVKKVSGI